jgi:hypothetical protein
MRCQFVDHLSKAQTPQQSVAKLIAIVYVNLVIPKAAVKLELSVNKLVTKPNPS